MFTVIKKTSVNTVFYGVGSFSQGVMDVRCGYGICCHGEEFQVQIDELKFYLIYLIRGVLFDVLTR
ncbi:hypothetical protein HanOQP8_Chr14g0507361 [Helianthus annuus]|nr:hypothetical protein HanOQP8_Chr14g0507361 [Helianthus annuus]